MRKALEPNGSKAEDQACVARIKETSISTATCRLVSEHLVIQPLVILSSSGSLPPSFLPRVPLYSAPSPLLVSSVFCDRMKKSVQTTETNGGWHQRYPCQLIIYLKTDASLGAMT